MEYLQISSIFSEKETTTNNKKQQKAFIDSNIAYYIIIFIFFFFFLTERVFIMFWLSDQIALIKLLYVSMSLICSIDFLEIDIFTGRE